VVQCLPKCAAGILVAELRPEQREEPVARNGSLDAFEREVRKQGQPLRLHANGRRFQAVARYEPHAPKGEKLAHSGRLQYRASRVAATDPELPRYWR
jgi:hypothetical protein